MGSDIVNVDLSIIIPHYNSARLLQKLLTSIPDCDNIETIVVDDNSNCKLDEYDTVKQCNPNVIFCTNDRKNKGAGAARNVGISKARGKWLLFADADDFFSIDFHLIVEQFFNDKSDIIYFSPTSCDLETCGESSRHIFWEQCVQNYLKKNNTKSEYALRYNYGVPWSKMIRKDLVLNNNILFDETLVANDTMFSTKVGFYASSIRAVDEVIYSWTRSSGTLTTTMNENIFFMRLEKEIEKYIFLKNNLVRPFLKYNRLCSLELMIRCYANKLCKGSVLKTYRICKESSIKLVSVSLFDPYRILRYLKNRHREKHFKKNKHLD